MTGRFRMSHQKILVALPLEEKLLQPLHEWGARFDWSHITEVHFLHIVKKTITPLEFGLVEMPDERTYNELIPSLEKYLKDESQKILPESFNGNVFFHVQRDFNPAEEIVNVIKNLGVTLLVVSTQGKHGFEGLFHSSFTDHMVKFAPCDVYV